MEEEMRYLYATAVAATFGIVVVMGLVLFYYHPITITNSLDFSVVSLLIVAWLGCCVTWLAIVRKLQKIWSE